jgi:hypothetical protein
MASTYSSLKIQLMGTGENSGTWGTITNTNLGTALEEAIVGSADVNFSSADVTLTLTDANSSQTARNLRLNLTGTVGAPQNLIVPAIEKVYIINNGLTQTITVKNTGGTGIAVPAGKTMYVYNNGTNVLDAVTHLTSLTLGSALPIASGGTGSTSTTYANLQSNVTGTLPVANGGTGATSLNAEAVVIGNSTSAVKFVAPGTTGNLLSSNGTAWVSVAPAAQGFDAGTVLIFAQTTAPTGWTKNTSTGDNSALRVVTGSASTSGSVDFTTAFASQTPTGSVSITAVSGSAGATTLTIPQIPSHTHSYPNAFGGDNAAIGIINGNRPQGSPTTASIATGGGGSHTHPFSFSSGSGTFSGSAINLAVKYVDVIRATKN